MSKEQIISKVVMDADSITTVMNNINSMYSNALGQIIAITAGILTLGGVVLPLVIAYYQKRQSKIDHEKFTRTISDEVAASRNALNDELKKELEEERGKLKSELERIRSEVASQMKVIKSGADGKTHHHIAVFESSHGKYASALIQYEIAISGYVVARDEYNLRICINNLLDSVLPKLNKSSFDDDLLKRVESVISLLKSINQNGRYGDAIERIREAHKAALGR